MYAVSLPFWYLAVNRVRRVLTQKTVPVMALFAAFAFVLMMFNIPLPGGTTGHAVGGTLLAIILGPWAAVLGISIVLGIQALFFGDGGLLTLGANCFNMAIALPLVGYFVYKVISSRADESSPRRILAAVAGSYLAIVTSAFLTGVELGLQPVFFHTANGTPLYAPYGLSVSLPAMLIGHLLVAGPVEAVVTGMVFAYLLRSRSSLVVQGAAAKKGSQLWILWGALAFIAILTPLGLLASGTAWGEWGTSQLQNLGLGFVPQGIQRFAGWWPAPLPGYGFSRAGAVVGYLVSAFLGIILVAFLLWLLGRWLASRKSPGTKAASSTRTTAIRGESLLIKNISSIVGALESVILLENHSRGRGLLQNLDSRLKLINFLLFVVLIGLARDLWTLAAIFLLGLVLCLVAKIPPVFFLKRVFLFLPIFTAVIALPALFITPGQPLVEIDGRVIITSQGANTAALLVLRVADSISFGVLLILTTPWNTLLAALRWFHVPALIVDILAMTYRYVFLLLHSTNSMFLARRSRAIGSFSGSENRKWLTRVLASTMIKSQHLSEQVYQAMLSRGYQGEVRILSGLKWQRRDYLWGLVSIALAAVLLWRDRW
jgi:cobalt/nickel transport system permease protein